MVVQYRIPRNLLEVYKTDEENFTPYTPNMGSTTTTDETENIEDGEDETTSTEETEDKEGFTLHQGEILETYYYGGFFDVECESDYEDINNSGSISLPSVDKERFYKGVRVLLRKGWENIGEHIDPLKLEEVLLGFITEQTYSEDGVELKLSGMTKLLEQEYKFNFTQKKISEILEEMIKTAGLVPVIDPTGLDDMVIDYTNISSDGDGGVNTSGIESDVNELVQNIIKGKTGCLDKAKAIYAWEQENISYEFYECSRYSSASECLQHLNALNCADTARLTRAMCSAAGLDAKVVHGPFHFWTVVTCNGQEYALDMTSKSRKFNEVWGGRTADRDCGDNPSC